MPVRSRTRETVLEVALALANARGLDRVTTAELAAAAGINEGNLYYYFRRKEQLAEALFERYSAAMLAVAERPIVDPADPQAYTAYQRGWFELMWAYRSFYRDAASLRLLAPGLRDRVEAINRRGQDAVRAVFQQMRAHGLLAASEAEIETLVFNLWIVSGYWMAFRGIEAGPELRQADLEWGYRQVEALCAPFLAGAARAEAGKAAITHPISAASRGEPHGSVPARRAARDDQRKQSGRH